MDLPIDSCPVCINSFNKRRVRVTCPKCHGDCCRDCFQTFIKTTTGDIICMHCKHPLDYDFIQQNTTKTFMKDDYKEYLENILLDKEKSLLSETLGELQNEIAAENIREKYALLNLEKSYELSLVDTEKGIIYNKIRQLQILEKMKNVCYTDDIKKLNDELTELKAKYNKTLQENEQLETEMYIKLTELGSSTESKERKKFIKPCPAADCRGLLSTQYVCGLCSTKVCPDCLEIKQDKEHTCKPEDVATTKLIKESTKSCPKCGINIHKIDGCDHMFCIECKTAFSYSTGKIHTNGNSNPLYWQWRQSQGDTQIPEPNCPEMTAPRITHIVIGLSTADYNLSTKLEYIIDFAIHLRDYEMPRLEIDYIEENKDLRKAYLKKRISEYEWKIQLQRRYKDSIKRKDIRNVYQIFVVESFNILFKLQQEFANMADSKTRSQSLAELHKFIPTVIKLMEEFDKLREYCNQQLLSISKRYNSVRYYITNTISGRIYIKNYETLNKGEL
jgi:hypothetical protein